MDGVSVHEQRASSESVSRAPQRVGVVPLLRLRVVDQLDPQVGLDMVRVLRRIGCEVSFPEEQTCCGQPAFNSGFWKDAVPLAERFVRIFTSAEAAAVIPSCCRAARGAPRRQR